MRQGCLGLWRRGLALAVLVGAAGLASWGCQEAAVQRLDIDTAEPLSVAFVVHGREDDPFWMEVRQGAEEASRAFLVDLSWRAVPDPARRGHVIAETEQQGFDALVVTLADPEAIGDAVQTAVLEGVTVYVINSGSAAAAELGADSYFGQVESVAGLAVGERFRDAGVTKLLCVKHEERNVALDTRCERSQFRVGAGTELQVDLSMTAGELEAAIFGALQADPELDGVLTMNTVLVGPGLSAVSRTQDVGREVVYGVFELDDRVLDAIELGRIRFAVDQQGYLQGYLPVAYVRLTEYSGRTQGDELADALLQWIAGGGVFLGPGFVDQTNVRRVREARQ